MNSVEKKIAKAIGFNPLRWLINTRIMKRETSAFLRHRRGNTNRNPRILVVIAPWQGTSVPWYTLALALFLDARGCDVSFVLDDCRFGNHPLRYTFVLYCLRVLMRLLQRQFEVVTLSTLADLPASEEPRKPLIQKLAKLNTIWHFRGEIVKVGRQSYIDQCAAQISRAERPIIQILEGGRHEILLTPGGVFGTSGLWVAHARQRGLRICSFDAGSSGVAIFSTDGIACHLADIPRAFQRLKSEGSPAEHLFAYDEASAEMEKRRRGVDVFTSQISGSGDGDTRHDGAVLLALNSSWDAAALGLHSVFADNTTWIIETVRYVLTNTSANVIVRQHPVERMSFAQTTDDYRELLQSYFGNDPRLHFIDASESINSYALLERVGLVVTYTSTIGVEAAALGKAVISPSLAYYADLGFVWMAKTKKEYEELISAALVGKLSVTPNMITDAHLCYYMTQCCNWFFSPFNPSDFVAWSKIGLNSLYKDEQVETVLQSLVEGIPLSYLQHRKKFLLAQVRLSQS